MLPLRIFLVNRESRFPLQLRHPPRTWPDGCGRTGHGRADMQPNRPGDQLLNTVGFSLRYQQDTAALSPLSAHCPQAPLPGASISSFSMGGTLGLQLPGPGWCSPPGPHMVTRTHHLFSSFSVHIDLCLGVARQLASRPWVNEEMSHAIADWKCSTRFRGTLKTHVEMQDSASRNPWWIFVIWWHWDLGLIIKTAEQSLTETTSS